MAQIRRSRTPLHERASKNGVLAAVVAARREEYGLKQVELAELAGCSARFVHSVENGKPALQLDKLMGLLETLGLHLEVAQGRSTTPGTIPAAVSLTQIYDLAPGGQDQATAER